MAREKLAASSLRDPVSLQRLDWRFLLPPLEAGVYERMVVLGAPHDLIQLVRETGIARHVHVHASAEHSADVVAVLAGAELSPQAAARSLAPGGVLYYEVDRRRPSYHATTPTRIAREVHDAGLTLTGCYWARPNFAHCVFYIPLDRGGALSWYVGTVFRRTTRPRRLLAPALLALVRTVGRSIGSLAPCFAVTAEAPGGERQEPWAGYGALPPDLRQPDLRPLVMMTGGDEHSRVILLPFAPGRNRPEAVLKASRAPDFNRYTEREQVLLGDIRARLDDELRPTLPEPLGLQREGRLVVSAESYSPGQRLAALFAPGRAVPQQLHDLDRAAGWLAAFHRQARVSEGGWDAEATERWCRTPIDSYRRRFGLNPDEGRLFSAVQDRVQALIGLPFPVVWQHHDFNELNVLRSERGLHVIDWERARPGPALNDLLYFGLRWSFLARGLHSEVQHLRGFKELFVQPRCDDQIVVAVRQSFERYRAAQGLDERFVPLLLVTTWVDHALDHFERLRALGRLTANVREGNVYTRFVEVLAAHVDVLFAPSRA